MASADVVSELNPNAQVFSPGGLPDLCISARSQEGEPVASVAVSPLLQVRDLKRAIAEQAPLTCPAAELPRLLLGGRELLDAEALAELDLSCAADVIVAPASDGEDELAEKAEPTRENVGLRPEAAVFIPTAGGFATLQAEAEEYARQLAHRQMPPASDETWEIRISKRGKEVETVKSLPSYKLYIERIPVEERGSDDPLTPDPRDRTVSKRAWKLGVEQWRLQLKTRCTYPVSMLLACRAACEGVPPVPVPRSVHGSLMAQPPGLPGPGGEGAQLACSGEGVFQ